MTSRFTGALVAALVLATACTEPEAPRGLRGTISPPDGVGGAAYLFLYAPGEGPPERPATPLHATAISRERLAAGDASFVFADVEPGAYRLSGFLDVDGDASLETELLLQPTAGDHLVQAQDVLVDEHGVATEPPALTFGPAERFDPPAFRVEGAAGTFLLTELAFPPVLLELVADPLQRLDPAATRLVLSLSEDRDGDGQLDLYPQVLLRFLPKPGQNVPLNTDGTPADVIVPTAFASTALLSLLAGDPSVELALERAPVLVIPQAQAIYRLASGAQAIVALPAVPVGDYELVVVQESGQVWSVPNALGAEDSSQAVRFVFAR